MKPFRPLAAALAHAIGVALLVLTLPGCYLTHQAYYQNNLINSRRPVGHVEADPATPEPVRAKLELLARVKAYAALKGLNSGGAYEAYVDNGSGAMSYLVFAAPIDKLQAKTWWFPIVGSVPYLGFFERADREAEADRLTAEGLDVYRGRSMAFSSLGYFEDPIYSSQVGYSDRLFSHTIFHELVHRTIWVPGSTQFNENLAEFVADQLNRSFLGEDIPAGESALEQRSARKKARIAFIGEAKAALGAFYEGRGRALLAKSRQLFLAEREKILAAVAKKYYKPSQTGASRVWNNASLLAASLYLPDYAIFAKAYACTGSTVPAFIAALKKATQNADGRPPETILATLCPTPATSAQYQPRRKLP